MFEEFNELMQVILNDSHSNVRSIFQGLTDNEIIQSVHEASVFFGMDDPINVHEDWTTGVMTNMSWTENDDVLIFSRDQMAEMGITDKEGFDLVMTHEGAHRMLQNMRQQTGFNSHQEELCCDYMAGVRAGLNGMDEGKMQVSLADTTASESHPDGQARIESIENGVAFAHDYWNEHHEAPTFTDCLEHFEKTDVYARAADQGDINLSPETEHAYAETDASAKAQEEHRLAELAAERGDYAEMREHERLEKAYTKLANEAYNDDPESTLKAYSKDEIARKLAHAEAEKRRYEALVRNHLDMAKNGLGKADTDYHVKQANNFQKRVDECAAEVNKWKWTKPDKEK